MRPCCEQEARDLLEDLGLTVDHEGTEHRRVGRWEGCRRRWSGCSVRCVAPCWSATTLPTTSPARRSMR